MNRILDLLKLHPRLGSCLETKFGRYKLSDRTRDNGIVSSFEPADAR